MKCIKFQVAVKIIDKTKMDEASTSQIMKEVRCMKLVQHANIVRLYEVILNFLKANK